MKSIILLTIILILILILSSCFGQNRNAKPELNKEKTNPTFEIPKTIKALEKWMKENCYNFNSYSINGNEIYEGHGIHQSGESFTWYYTERGQKDNIKDFQKEEDIIKYAYDQIKLDKWANAHCIGFIEKEAKAEELTEILTQMDIQFMQDQIPYYGIDRPIYRVFVFGCDRSKTIELKEKYYEKQDLQH